MTVKSSKNSIVFYKFLWIRIGHVNIFSWMITVACCSVVGLRIRVRFSVWLVYGYARIFILLSVVINTPVVVLWWWGVGLVIERSRVWVLPTALLSATFTHSSQVWASVCKQYNLVLVGERWCSEARKVTAYPHTAERHMTVRLQATEIMFVLWYQRQATLKCVCAWILVKYFVGRGCSDVFVVKYYLVCTGW